MLKQKNQKQQDVLNTKTTSPYQLWLIENKAILDIEDKIEKYESLI